MWPTTKPKRMTPVAAITTFLPTVVPKKPVSTAAADMQSPCRALFAARLGHRAEESSAWLAGRQAVRTLGMRRNRRRFRALGGELTTPRYRGRSPIQRLHRSPGRGFHNVGSPGQLDEVEPSVPGQAPDRDIAE